MKTCPRCLEPCATLTGVHNMPTDYVRALQAHIAVLELKIDQLQQGLSGERAAMGTIEELMFGEEA